MLDILAGAPPCQPQPNLDQCAAREREYSESLFKLRCALDSLRVMEAHYNAVRGTGSAPDALQSPSAESKLTSP